MIPSFLHSKSGNTFILVLQDIYSKRTEMYLTKSVTAKTVRASSKDFIIPCYGAPEALVTDNGVQVITKTLKCLAEEYRILPHSTVHTPVESC